MGYKSPIFSFENLAKAILRLTLHLHSHFFKFTRNRNLMNGSINFLISEIWLDDQIKVCFSTLACIVNKQDLANDGRLLGLYKEVTIEFLQHIFHFDS